MKWTRYIHNGDDLPVFLIKELFRIRGCTVSLHCFIKADAEGCFHSHPAWAFRLVLWGGYVEETGAGRWRTWFPGRFGIVRPDFEHRIGGLRNGRSSWSLWLRGPKVASINVRGCDEPEDRDDCTLLVRRGDMGMFVLPSQAICMAPKLMQGEAWLGTAKEIAHAMAGSRERELNRIFAEFCDSCGIGPPHDENDQPQPNVRALVTWTCDRCDHLNTRPKADQNPSPQPRAESDHG